MTIGIINRFNLAILVDYRYLGYRSAFRFADFSVDTPQGPLLTGSLFGILQFIELIATNYPYAQIFLCLDGKPLERQKLFEGYKKSRVHPDPSNLPSAEVTTFRALHDEPFKMLGGIPNLYAVYHPEKEADDLIAKLSILNREAGKDVVVFTSDKDMMQLMQYGVNMSKEISDGEFVLLTEEYLLNHKALGVEPQYIPYLRPWKGDPSDDIPPAVSRVTSEVLKEIAKGWHDSGQQELTEEILTTIIDSITTVNVTDKTREKLIQGIDQANINFKLMDLTRYKTEAIDSVQLKPLTYEESVIDYYQLNKYKAWRTGVSIVTVDPDSILSSGTPL